MEGESGDPPRFRSDPDLLRPSSESWFGAPRRAAALLLILLIVALVVRGSRGHEGLPYIHHWDEPQVANRALAMLESGDPNPHYFIYPSLATYLHAATDLLHLRYLKRLPLEAPGSLRSLDELEIPAGKDWVWQVSHPSFYLWNRWLTALFGTACVALAFAVGRDLGGVRAGLASAALLAVLPFHVRHSAFATTDVPASTLAFGAAWLTLRYLRGADRRWLWGALTLTGLAASTKYNLAIILLAPLAALLGRVLDGEASLRHGSWLALAVVPVAAFLAGTPYALLDFETFTVDVLHQLRMYSQGGQTMGSIEPGLPHLAADLRSIAQNLGWPAALLALLGLGRAFRSRSGLSIYIVPIALLLVASRARLDFHRNLMLVYPFAAVAFGLGAVWLWDLLVGRIASGGGRARMLDAGLALLAVAATGWACVAGVADARARVQQAETRSQIVTWINEQLAAGDGQRPVIAVASELRIHRLDLSRIRGIVTQRTLLNMACYPRDEDWVLVPSRYATSDARLRVTVDLYNRALASGGEVAHEIEPRRSLYFDHLSNDPGVAVRRPWRPVAVPLGVCTRVVPDA